MYYCLLEYLFKLVKKKVHEIIGAIKFFLHNLIYLENTKRNVEKRNPNHWFLSFIINCDTMAWNGFQSLLDQRRHNVNKLLTHTNFGKVENR